MGLSGPTARIARRKGLLDLAVKVVVSVRHGDPDARYKRLTELSETCSIIVNFYSILFYY